MKEHKSLPLIELLLRGYTWFDSVLAHALDSYGLPKLSRPQTMLFGYLVAEGVRSSVLARRLGVTRQAVHVTVKDLENMGLVAQVPDPSNKSAKLVRRTEKGEQVVVAALKIFARAEEELKKRVGLTEMTTLRRALEADWGPPEFTK